MADYKVHPTAVVDENVEIGKGSSIWHYSHIQPGAKIGKCTLGQNVNVANNVVIGNFCKIQNNVSVYEVLHLRITFSAAVNGVHKHSRAKMQISSERF